MKRAATLSSAENVATEVVLRLSAQEAFLDSPESLHDIAAALATELSADALRDAEYTARVVQKHLFGGDSRNNTKFLDMRLKRGGRAKREQSR